MSEHTILWKGKAFPIVLSQYIENGNTCIVALAPDGSGLVEAKATANLGKLPPHECYIKNYSENRGIEEALLQQRLIEPSGLDPVKMGAVTFKRFRICESLCATAGIPYPKPEPEFDFDLGASQAIPEIEPPTPAEEPASPPPRKKAVKKKAARKKVAKRG